MSINASIRRESAERRQQDRAARTPEQQIERLDSLLGVGVGAVKERARLAQQIQNNLEAKPPKKGKK